MTSIRHRLFALVRDEAGVSLAESLSVSLVFLVLAGASMGIYTAAVSDQTSTSGSVDTLETARPKVDQIARDLRQASSFTPGTTTTQSGVAYADDVTISTYRRGQGFISVYYDCRDSSATRCLRTQGGSTDTVLSDLSHVSGQPGYFSWDPATNPPRTVTLSVRKRVDKRSPGTSYIELTDGVCLRNLGGLCAS